MNKVDRAVRMVKSGKMNAMQAAKKVGCHFTSVYGRMKRDGIKVGPRGIRHKKAKRRNVTASVSESIGVVSATDWVTRENDTLKAKCSCLESLILAAIGRK